MSTSTSSAVPTAPSIDLVERGRQLADAQLLLAHAWSRLLQARARPAQTGLDEHERAFATVALLCCETFAALGEPEPLGLSDMARSIITRVDAADGSA